MPATSQAQQKFFGMVHAGNKKRPKGMTATQVDEFASTKRKGLPKHSTSKAARRRKIAEMRAAK